MFDREYRFTGIHALRVEKLTSKFADLSKAKVFSRNVDVLCNAPLIGFLYGRMAPVDKTMNPETKDVYSHKVMGDRVIFSSEEMLFNFRLIMLLDKEYEPEASRRIDKAFRTPSSEDEERYNAYVRGGVDVLYEKLVENATSMEDFVNNLCDCVSDFDESFNQSISDDELAKFFMATENS